MPSGTQDSQDEEPVDSKPRVLQTGIWSPDDDEAGIDASFPDDPAEITVNHGERITFSSLFIFIFMMVVVI